jgi:NADPH-dependent curcumin reductase
MNRCVRLVSHPVGTISKTDLKLSNEEIPKAADGQVIVKNLYASIDPTHRIWMNGKKAQYMDPVPLGDIMRAATVGVVVESKNEAFPVGKKVFGFGGICDYYVGIPGVTLVEMCACESDPEIEDTFELTYGGLIIGLTAWHGINKIIEPKQGDVVVISGAAGAVGSLAGQLAKNRGAKVIGIAGGVEKCKYLIETLGFDHAIDYKTENIEEKLKEYAPEGVEGYFDNVGGDSSEAVLMNARNGMAMALCGSISEYDDNWSGIKNFNMILMRRIKVQGFICLDHGNELAEARAEMVQLKKEGKLVVQDDMREGIENYVDVVNLLFCGGNRGKLMLKINDA